jgi:hypothetical protein
MQVVRVVVAAACEGEIVIRKEAKSAHVEINTRHFLIHFTALRSKSSMSIYRIRQMMGLSN